jgi:hypothetical protein
MYTYGSPIIINCTFYGNWASEGAGIYNIAEPTLTGCIFTNNSAGKYGGGMCNERGGSELTITNCIFSGNSAEMGGGVFNTWGARMGMANCTFAGNVSSNGSALAIDPNLPSLPEFIQLTNCIIWNGDKAIHDPFPLYPLKSAITYSNIQGGWEEGEGNIDIDPLFADPGYWADANDPNFITEPNDPNAVWIDGDYHLKSQAGRYDPKSKSWVMDDATSPCIDAGDPNSSISDEPEPNGNRINMGAYGGTIEASKSYGEE